jgi:CheY-specific phosphatase CheX
MENIKKTEETLMRSIFEVFEKMFFIFAEPSRDPMRSCRMKATIGFEGPFPGDMEVRISNDLLKRMATNMLNLEEEEVTDAVMEDCLKEAINMVCGSFLRKVEPDHVFQLSIPVFEKVAADPGNDKQGPSEIRLSFASEDSGFEVRFRSPSLASLNRI